MKSLNKYLLEAASQNLKISDLNAFTKTNINNKIYTDINNALDLFDGDLDELKLDDILELIYDDEYTFKHIGDKYDNWVEVKNNKSGKVEARILIGGTYYDINDLNNFKYKNEPNTIIYGFTKDGEHFAIIVKKLIEYYYTHNVDEIDSPPAENGIKFNSKFLSEL